jgi:lauroyl/myristoyl acyltransferase
MAYDLYLLTVVAVMRLIEWSGSVWLRDSVAGWLGSAAYRISHRKRTRVEAGVRAALKPEPGVEARIVEGSFRSFWADLFALLLADQPERQVENAHIRGLRHLEEALQRGRGAILLESGNFGQRNLSKRVLHARGFHLHQGHSVKHLAGFWNTGDTLIKARVVRPFFERCERRFMDEIMFLPDGESPEVTQRMLAILKENGCLCISGGGGPRQEHFLIEFLGETRLFASGLVTLARLSGAPLLPLYCWRDAESLQVVIEPELDIGDGEEGALAAMTEYARQLESYARRHPDQYRTWRGRRHQQA